MFSCNFHHFSWSVDHASPDCQIALIINCHQHCLTLSTVVCCLLFLDLNGLFGNFSAGTPMLHHRLNEWQTSFSFLLISVSFLLFHSGYNKHPKQKRAATSHHHIVADLTLMKPQCSNKSDSREAFSLFYCCNSTDHFHMFLVLY